MRRLKCILSLLLIPIAPTFVFQLKNFNSSLLNPNVIGSETQEQRATLIRSNAPNSKYKQWYYNQGLSISSRNSLLHCINVNQKLWDDLKNFHSYNIVNIDFILNKKHTMFWMLSLVTIKLMKFWMTEVKEILPLNLCSS